jgi:hypothetical protein
MAQLASFDNHLLCCRRWLTLVMMFGMNCLAEHHAAAVIRAAVQSSHHLLSGEQVARVGCSYRIGSLRGSRQSSQLQLQLQNAVKFS